MALADALPILFTALIGGVLLYEAVWVPYRDRLKKKLKRELEREAQLAEDVRKRYGDV